MTYYCVRNNALAKMLEAAALEIVQASTAALQVKDASQGGKAVDVAPGFAQDSGLKDLWGTGPKTGPGELTPQDIAKTATDRHPTEPVPTIGERSNILGSQQPTNESRNDKAYDKSTGLNWDEQATITRADVPDISIEELKLLYERKGGDPSKISEAEWLTRQSEYKNKPTKQVRWETGLGNIEVLPGSFTRTLADKFRARIDGGISGSTDLVMHAAVHLGVTSAADKKHLRLALVAWMLSNKDHSFFEIMRAAEGYGLPFHLDEKRPGAEYEHEDNFAPLGKPRVAGFKDLMADKRMPSEVFAGKELDTRAEGKRDTRTSPASTEAPPDVLLTNLGVPATSLAPGTTDAAFVAHYEAFSAAVQNAQIGDPATEDGLRHTRVAVQKLREDVSFQWMGVHHISGVTYVEPLLERLIETRAGHPADREAS